MGKFILCAGVLAREPYCFSLTNTNVYSLEELGYYLYHNINAVTMETFDQKFFQWVDMELKRPDLAEKWMDIKNRSQDIKDITVSILCATDYFTKLEIESFIKTVDQINDMPLINRQKLKADMRLRYQDYDQALKGYRAVISSEQAQELSAKDYGNVLHNMAVIHVKMKLFEQAQREFLQAYSLNENEESLREYFYLLKLQKKEKEFMHGVLDYDLSEEKMLEYTQELDAILEDAENTPQYKKILELPELKKAGKVGDYYYAIDTMIFGWKQKYKHGMEQG